MSVTGWSRVFFPQNEIPNILEMVLDCGKNLRKSAPQEHENELNKKLFWLIRTSPRYRVSPWQVTWEHYLFDELAPCNAPIVLGRIDIHFSTSTVPSSEKLQPYFAIEAKRLHVTSRKAPNRIQKLLGSYVRGAQGMRCFTEGRYAQGLKSGAMLGYVYDANITAATKGISDAVTRYSSLLKLKSPPGMVKRTQPLGVLESSHEGPHGEFIIYHMFLPV